MSYKLHKIRAPFQLANHMVQNPSNVFAVQLSTIKKNEQADLLSGDIKQKTVFSNMYANVEICDVWDMYALSEENHQLDKSSDRNTEGSEQLQYFGFKELFYAPPDHRPQYPNPKRVQYINGIEMHDLYDELLEDRFINETNNSHLHDTRTLSSDCRPTVKPEYPSAERAQCLRHIETYDLNDMGQVVGIRHLQEAPNEQSNASETMLCFAEETEHACTMGAKYGNGIEIHELCDMSELADVLDDPRLRTEQNEGPKAQAEKYEIEDKWQNPFQLNESVDTEVKPVKPSKVNIPSPSWNANKVDFMDFKVYVPDDSVCPKKYLAMMFGKKFVSDLTEIEKEDQELKYGTLWKGAAWPKKYFDMIFGTKFFSNLMKTEPENKNDKNDKKGNGGKGQNDD